MARCEICGAFAQSYHNRLVCFHHRKDIDHGETNCGGCGKITKTVERIRVGFFKWKYLCKNCVELESAGGVR